MSKRLLAIIVVLGLLAATALVVVVGRATKPVGPTKVRIGTLQTEDALPLFVAAEKGYFKKKNLDVEIQTFPSAQERDAALQAGKIDGFMGDLISASLLENGGVDVSVVTTMLGASPKEGRFALMVPGNSPIKSVKQLKNVPVAVSKNTIIEYVTEEMLKEYGLKKNEIKTIEIKQVPVRQEMIVAGIVKAGTLPDPFATLAAKRGARVLVDDTKGKNLSQTILLFRQDFIDENYDAVTSFLEAENTAVKTINADPAAFQAFLIQKARIPTVIARTYTVGEYPKVQAPTKSDVERVLNWMKGRKLVKDDVTYEGLVNQEVQPQ
ncbi:MAG: ABC transporter substrate-binding protein [Candidatus Aquicultorales bacterium]